MVAGRKMQTGHELDCRPDRDEESIRDKVSRLDDDALITLLKVLTCKDGEEEKIYRDYRSRASR